MSNATEEGITKVKTTACEMLLKQHAERHMLARASAVAAAAASVAAKMDVVRPVARDRRARPAMIPEAIRAQVESEKAARDAVVAKLMDQGYDAEGAASELSTIVREQKEARRPPGVPEIVFDEDGVPGVFVRDAREQYELADASWRFDVVPEIMDGKNVADFYDPDIADRLAELEAEEAELEAAFAEAGFNLADENAVLTAEQLALFHRVLAARERIKLEARMRPGRGVKSHNPIPRSLRPPDKETALDRMTRLNMDIDKAAANIDTARAKRERSRSRIPDRDATAAALDAALGEAAWSEAKDKGLQPGPAKRRGRSRTRADDGAMGDDAGAGAGDGEAEHKDGGDGERLRSLSRARSLAGFRSKSHTRDNSRARRVAPLPGQGYENEHAKKKAEKMLARRWTVEKRLARAGEGDNKILNEMPRHLYSGKISNGTRDRR